MEPIKREITIAGKRAKIRERIPLRDGSRIQTLMQAAGNSEELRDYVPIFALLLEPCELVPDPSDAAAYEEMDTFDIILPLVDWTGLYCLSRVAAAREAAKN